MRVSFCRAILSVCVIYTTDNLRTLLDRADFEPVLVSPTNALGLLISVAKHYALPARKYAHHEVNHQALDGEGGILVKLKVACGNSLAERIMRKTLSIEGALIKHLRIPFGHTHIALARKPGMASS